MSLKKYINENGVCIIPDNVRKIGSLAFINCYDEVKRIIIPPTVKDVSETAFNKCVNLREIICPDNLISHISDKYAAVLIGEAMVPAEMVIRSKTQKHIYNGLRQFIDRDGNCIMPNNITKIRGLEFFKCEYLKSIAIQLQIEKIPFGLFKGCRNLEKVVINSNVKEICDEAFDGCGSLERIRIPASVKKIGVSVFRDCSSLKRITIPKNVTEIGRYAFDGCKSLKRVNCPEHLLNLKEYINAEFDAKIKVGAASVKKIIIAPLSLEDIEEIAAMAYRSNAFAPPVYVSDINVNTNANVAPIRKIRNDCAAISDVNMESSVTETVDSRTRERSITVSGVNMSNNKIEPIVDNPQQNIVILGSESYDYAAAQPYKSNIDMNNSNRVKSAGVKMSYKELGFEILTAPVIVSEAPHNTSDENNLQIVRDFH